jgi:hypothetical protein
VAAAGAAAAAAAAEVRFLSLSKAKIWTSILGVRAPRIRIGDNLAQIKVMRLANVQTFDPNVWHPSRVLSVPQIDLFACADRKMVNLCVYLRNFTKKSRFYRTDTQIRK